MTSVVRADALRLPLADNSVDLIVTSPPYYAARSYRDGGVHYDGQTGSEATPQEFIDTLCAASKEMYRVLKPTGSAFINLGDKRSGSGGHNNNGLGSSTLGHHKGGGGPHSERMKATRRNAPDRYNQAAFGRPKSKMALPHRYFIACMDGLADPDGVGWIARQDIVWHKLNGLPESVKDRTRDSHEYIFHLTKSERYFAAVDEVREAHTAALTIERDDRGGAGKHSRGLSGRPDQDTMRTWSSNPLGKLPGSVWSMASEPLYVPPFIVEDETGWRFYGAPGTRSTKGTPKSDRLRRQLARHLRDLRRAGRHPRVGSIDHFAAFPQEIPRRLILGWSPTGICVECGEPRRPVVAKEYSSIQAIASTDKTRHNAQGNNFATRVLGRADSSATITGYACACPDTSAPTRPAVVLDCFGGTGTTALVARALGRTGISIDLSGDYCRLAQWRIFHSGHGAKTRERTNREAQQELAI